MQEENGNWEWIHYLIVDYTVHLKAGVRLLTARFPGWSFGVTCGGGEGETSALPFILISNFVTSHLIIYLHAPPPNFSEIFGWIMKDGKA